MQSKILQYSLIGFGSLITLWVLLSGVVLFLTPGSLFNNQISWAPVPNYGYELEFIPLENTQKISLWSFEDESSPEDVAILYLHGNTGRVNDMIISLSEYGTVFAPSYPGYGESEGTPNSENVYEAALTAYDYLVEEKGIDQDKIIIFGHSMGGSPAVYVASQRPEARKLILVNTFSSVQSMCFRSYSIFCSFTGNILNTAKNAQNVTIPVRQFHYRGDTTVPFEEGETLFEYFESTDDKEFVALDNYTHTYPDFNVISSEISAEN